MRKEPAHQHFGGLLILVGCHSDFCPCLLNLLQQLGHTRIWMGVVAEMVIVIRTEIIQIILSRVRIFRRQSPLHQFAYSVPDKFVVSFHRMCWEAVHSKCMIPRSSQIQHRVYERAVEVKNEKFVLHTLIFQKNLSFKSGANINTISKFIYTRRVLAKI